MNETQRKLVEAAEIEFAEMGYGGASIREITRRAGVNVAAVNYHFGSKEILFKEMVRYRIEPINRLRIELLDGALEDNDGKPLPLERVIDFIVRPLLDEFIGQRGGDFRFMRAMGKALAEERAFMKELHQDILKEVIAKFSRAISDSLAEPGFEKVSYGMHFLSCCILGVMMQHSRLQFISGGKIDLHDVEKLADHLVAVISAGLNAVAKVKAKD